MRYAKFLSSFLSFLLIDGHLEGSFSNQEQENLSQEGKVIMEQSLKIAEMYNLPKGVQFKDITNEVFNHSTTTSSQKARLLHYHRKIFLFQYPSDGFFVKGFISFTPHSIHQPLLIVLRGGNREFGLLNPANDLVSYKDYIVLTTTYRGGVSEGKDEFGGTDVNDVKNLMSFFPKLEERLDISFQPSQVFMLGASRGAMEMFLALSRYPDLQMKIDKIVSLSGILDLRELMQERPDMTEMFKQDFGLTSEENEEDWINTRDPILATSQIRKDLPILILEGTDDERIGTNQGHNLLQKLKETQHQNVTYWELYGGKHSLQNMTDRMNLIVGWLELSY